MIIYPDINADPQEIARVLRRELGSELCRRVGRALAEERFVLDRYDSAASCGWGSAMTTAITVMVRNSRRVRRRPGR